MSSSNNNSGGGIGILTMLTIVFVVLKLVDVIDWSWWLVLAPTWIPFALFAVIAIPVAIVGAVKVRHW